MFITANMGHIRTLIESVPSKYSTQTPIFAIFSVYPFQCTAKSGKPINLRVPYETNPHAQKLRGVAIEALQHNQLRGQIWSWMGVNLNGSRTVCTCSKKKSTNHLKGFPNKINGQIGASFEGNSHCWHVERERNTAQKSWAPTVLTHTQ